MKNKREPSLVLLGAGSHARVVLDILKALGLLQSVVGAVNLYPRWRRFRPVPSLEGIPVLEWVEVAALLRRTRRPAAVPAIGDNRLREQAALRARALGFEILGVFHPSAVISPRATLGKGAVVCARAVVGTGARLGEGAIVNTGAIVDHDGRIGPYAHVAPGARLAGNVTVGARAWVGLGACVREGTRIGPDAVIGAGAVAVKNVPAGVAVAGIPARRLARFARK